MTKRLLAALMIAAMMLMLFAGCGNTASTEAAGSAEAAASSVAEEPAEEAAPAAEPASANPAAEEASVAEEASAAEEAPAEEAGVQPLEPAEYPIAEDVTLTAFMAQPGGPPCVRDSWAEYEIYDDAVVQAYAGCAPVVKAIGDCEAPGFIGNATLAAYEAAVTL